MKKIIVTSDTHGNAGYLYDIYKQNKKADLFIHLGDYIRDAQKAAKRLGLHVVCIKANGDIGSSFPVRRVIAFEGKNVLAVHGHIERVKFSLTRLNFLAQDVNADIVLFGHTHYPLIENNGTLFVNPGYGGVGQYAIVTIDKGAVNAHLMKL